ELCKVSRITATRDLSELVEKGILMRVGRGKRGIKYVIQMMQK
ncbi:DeoR family transcriptional regulator, partial [Thermococcus sp. ES12]|nr:DeoR family transcriptional regulator [Thermococcus sp. ES12]